MSLEQLILWCQKNEVAEVQRAIQSKANVSGVDSGSNTPLLEATANQNYQIVNMLLNAKASLTTINQIGRVVRLLPRVAFSFISARTPFFSRRAKRITSSLFVLMGFVAESATVACFPSYPAARLATHAYMELFNAAREDGACALVGAQ